jgi:PLP dependent protein
MNIEECLQKIQAKLAQTGCRLIAVSKTHPVEAIAQAYAAGQRLFGENKVQEMAAKQPQLPPDIEWHLIGHLQRNKVKYIAPFVAMIHSVDSLKLLEEINKQAAKSKRVIHCLLQVHIAEEETKFGMDEQEIRALLAEADWAALANVKVAGLMGMATFTEDARQIRREFHGLRLLFEALKSESLPAQVEMKELSMGMSGDYPIALEEGSTLVRVGSAIFGARDYSN